VGPKGYGTGVTIPDPEIDIGQCTIKGRGARIIDRLVGTREAIDEPKHVFGVTFILRVGSLETGGIFPEKEEGAVFAAADQPDGGWDINRLRDEVFSFRNEADGSLKGIRDVHAAVGLNIEFFRGEINGVGIFRAEGEEGAAGLGNRGGGNQEGQEETNNNNDMARPFHSVKSNRQAYRPFF